jgi:hypothetical protein
MSSSSAVRGRRAPGGRPLLAGLAVVAAATLLALVAVVAILREPAGLDPASPEGQVQDYVQAVLDGDVHAAHDHLGTAAGARCSVAELRRAGVPEGLTVSLDQVRRVGAGAEVVVRLRSVARPDPFGGGGPELETFELVREHGRWVITGEPWPLYDCRG